MDYVEKNDWSRNMQQSISNFNSYVNLLIERGDINIVEREVDPEYELAAVISQSQKESGRAILFRNVKGTEFPVIANVYGSFARMSELVGAEDNDWQRKWLQIFSELPLPNYDYINEVDPPQALEHGGLRDLPAITYREKDAAPYITAGVFLALNPDTGVPNLSFSRCMLLDDDTRMHCCIDSPHDLAKYQAAAERRNVPLDVAILIGAPPAVFLAAVSTLPMDRDEMQLAAHISGGKIDMRKCEHIDLLVPAETAIVIEARIRPGERAEDGPFGEFLGYYSGVNKNAYILDVFNVTWLKSSYYHALLCGAREDLTALSVSWGGLIFRELVKTMPGILDVTINPTLYACVVKINKQSDTHVREVIERVFHINPAYNRMCLVVDRDIDIQDLDSIWWSFLTRGNLDSRIYVLSDLPGVENANYEFSGYVGVDATTQPGLDLIRSTTPGESEICLHEYFV